MARPRSTTLSTAHRKIARAILAIERGGFPALVSGLVEKLGLAGASSLAPTLAIMRRNGFVSIDGGGQGRDRLVKLTPKGRHAMGEGGGLPVLGAIQAGVLEEAVAEPEEIVEPDALLPYRPGDFLLRVRGDSMVGDGILPGDLVLLRPGVAVEWGEIAAVIAGGGEEGELAGECRATLKRVYQEGKAIRLKAGNPRYADQLVPAGAVKIAGVFRGLIRHAASR